MGFEAGGGYGSRLVSSFLKRLEHVQKQLMGTVVLCTGGKANRHLFSVSRSERGYVHLFIQRKGEGIILGNECKMKQVPREYIKCDCFIVENNTGRTYGRTDERTDGRTDQRTEMTSYRDA